MKRLIIIIIIMIAGLATPAGAQVVGIGQADMVTASGTIGVGDPPIELTVTGRTIATITLVSSAATTGSVEFHVQAGAGPWAPIAGFDTLANSFTGLAVGTVPASHTLSFNVSGVDKIRIQEACCLSTIDGDTVWLLQAMVGSAPSQTGNAVTVTSGNVTVNTVNALNTHLYGQIFGVLEPEPGLAVNVADATPNASSMGLVTRNIPSGVQDVNMTLPDEGQQTMANSISVAVASNQSSLPVKLRDASDNALASAITTPGGADRGLVVRNIPSGTQSTTMGSGNLTAWGTVTFDPAAALSDTYANPTAVPPIGAFLMGWDAGFARWERAQMVPATGYLGIFNTNQPALVAGSAIIGKVGIDQTTPGTTNGVRVNAGTAIMGQVGIDQTTPGTTNRVDIGVFPDNEPINVAQFGGSAVATGTGAGGAGVPRVTVSNDSTVGLVAGSAIIGRVGIDQTTPGTTNRVDIGVFPDNEPIDVARFGGSAVVTGTGVSGAGIPRVTAAMDPVTGNAPTAASVGVASAQALAANASRKAAFFINTSSATISCAESGQAAVLNSGITLVPGAVYNMVPPFVTTGAVNCIAGAAASNLSILEKQ